MKKTYIAPEMEIKKFSVEDIMTNSSVATPDAYTAADVTDNMVSSIDYNEVFGIDA